MDVDQVSCPICGKEFASSIIESHANKCLFLNESAKDEASFLKDSSPVSKRMKLKPASVKKITAVGKRKSLEYFSSQRESSRRDEENVPDSLDVTSQKSVIIIVNNSRIKIHGS